MIKIYSEEIKKITKNKRKIESNFNVKLKIDSKEKIISIEGNPENEYLTSQTIEAINLGFSIEKALFLKEENFSLEKINVKNITKRKDLFRIRGRIIGKNGRVIENLESLTGCYLKVKDNTIGIIGANENIEKMSSAVKKIISGSEHSKVYSYLEKQNLESRQI